MIIFYIVLISMATSNLSKRKNDKLRYYILPSLILIITPFLIFTKIFILALPKQERLVLISKEDGVSFASFSHFKIYILFYLSTVVFIIIKLYQKIIKNKILLSVLFSISLIIIFSTNYTKHSLKIFTVCYIFGSILGIVLGVSNCIDLYIKVKIKKDKMETEDIKNSVLLNLFLILTNLIEPMDLIWHRNIFYELIPLKSKKNAKINYIFNSSIIHLVDTFA